MQIVNQSIKSDYAKIYFNALKWIEDLPTIRKKYKKLSRRAKKVRQANQSIKSDYAEISVTFVTLLNINYKYLNESKNRQPRTHLS